MRASPPKLSVRRFYSLEYFYILLKSVSHHSNKEIVFDLFKELKQQHRLGESKFKKLTADPIELTPTQLQRYRYTFELVLEESKEYDLLKEDGVAGLTLTNAGTDLLISYGTDAFLTTLFLLMERNSNAFRYIIERIYSSNRELLVLPIYSPNQLGIERKTLRYTSDIRKYASELASQLSQDLNTHLGRNLDLSPQNDECIRRIVSSELLPQSDSDAFDQANYNAIVSRFRKFWLTYFLQEIYEFDLSLTSFDIWSYRGKQFGVIHATEFYPSFHGRVVYPTSVLVSHEPGEDFVQLYDYKDVRLYRHIPVRESDQDKFIGSLVTAYYTIRKTQRAYFINLPSLRELVCYHLRISEATFSVLLDKAYKHNLAGDLRVQISLEVDRLPEDTREAYLKQEPVVIDGKPRNIIAIETKDWTNG